MSQPTPRSAELLAKMIALDMVIVFSEPREKFKSEHHALLEAHLLFQIDLEKRGLLFAAGPMLTDEGSPDGHGLTILNVASISRARELWAEEPFHQAGLRADTFRRWRINEGALNLKLGFSTGSFEIERSERGE
jgi:uncharacterized protein YciI